MKVSPPPSTTDFLSLYFANLPYGYVVETEPRPREAEEEKEDKAETALQTETFTGAEIESRWKASEDH